MKIRYKNEKELLEASFNEKRIEGIINAFNSIIVPLNDLIKKLEVVLQPLTKNSEENKEN